MEKKRILCFGDSLTWGYNPKSYKRFDASIRWTGVLQDKLGDDYVVIEEGQNGRTISVTDHTCGNTSAMDYIVPCLQSHNPLDYIVIMLGTNDLKKQFSLVSSDVSVAMSHFIQKVLSCVYFELENRPKVILVAPPVIGENIAASWLGEVFDYENGRKKSKELSDWYKLIALKYRISFFDAAKHAVTCDFDSLHLDADNNRKLGEAMADYILENMEKGAKENPKRFTYLD